MRLAHFSKVRKSTSWNGLLEVTQAQMLKKCKPLCYNILIELCVPFPEFDHFVHNLSMPNPLYLQYALDSVPDKTGIWNCIVIICESDKREIAIYTAGRTFPLYAAIVKA